MKVMEKDRGHVNTRKKVGAHSLKINMEIRVQNLAIAHTFTLM